MKKRARKNQDALSLLKVVGHLSLSFVDILDALSQSHSYYGSKKALQRIEKRHQEFNTYLEEQKQREKIYKLIHRLEQQGLLQKNKNKKTSFWFITKKGLERKSLLEQQNTSKDYLKEKSKDWKIVIFDIPESKKKHRAWLRSALRNLDFEMLQKSVWIGKNKTPEEFIKDLKRFDILDYVKIFSVKKSGNIKDT